MLKTSPFCTQNSNSGTQNSNSGTQNNNSGTQNSQNYLVGVSTGTHNKIAGTKNRGQGANSGDFVPLCEIMEVRDIVQCRYSGQTTIPPLILLTISVMDK